MPAAAFASQFVAIAVAALPSSAGRKGRNEGAKSASLLLARYGTLEQIPSSHTSWDVAVRGAARLSESLEERRPEAQLYKTLTTLRHDVPLEESLEDLEWRGVRAGWGGGCV